MPRTPHASVKLKHRITSLERWGMRESADFQSQSVACIQEAGFNGVLVNGGSGIGPDMMTPESLVHSDVIPDLMPRTIKGNQREMNRRCELLTEVDIKPWICMWGVPGADTSSGTAAAESNRLFSRLTRHEIQAKFDRTPDIFGQRGAGGLSWRGSRPLCISHPTVQAYYRDLIQQLIKTYCLQGIFYFPGDHQPETCDDNCPRCKATGKDSWQRMLEYVNMLYEAAIGVNPDFKMYFTFWNVRDTDPERARIKQMISQLHPGLGICMSLSDVGYDERPGGQMQFDQPWVIRAQPGELFVTTAKLAHEQQRPIMAMGEISQAELWDPVCHNMPNPQKVLQWLTHANQVPGIDAICDFWGHRRPYHSHANHRAMHAWLDDPTASHDVLLQRSIAAHYGLPDDKPQLLEQAIACQKAFDKTVDEWALLAWSQRFSYAIGRDAARGRLYTALIPQTFKKIDAGFWDQRFKVQCEDGMRFMELQLKDSKAWLKIAEQFNEWSIQLDAAGNMAGARLAKRESLNIALAAELIASQGRTLGSLHAYNTGDTQSLGQIIDQEIDARERQLLITGELGDGAGINVRLVSEDIQNMRLYLSHDAFPDVDDALFSFTATPYTV